MYFADALTLDAPRRTKDGYLVVRANAARTGVYQYSGRDVDPDNAHGLRDEATIHVLRDEKTVFDKRAAHSFIGKPITDDHPKDAVTANNWRDVARGTVMGAAWEPGGYLAFDLMLTDAEAIAKVDGGKRELSNGYDAKLEFGDFTAADGTKCQARQVSIDGNHVALVDRGRAGPSCRIADVAHCDAAPKPLFDSLTTQEKPVKTMLIDGLTVDVSNADTAIATINTILAARDGALKTVKDHEATIATLTTEKSTLDAQVKTLEQQVKDAKPTPAQLRDAGKALMLAAGKAKALGVAVTDAMDEPAIMKAVVSAKMGDTAKDWNDEQIAASFAVLAKDAKVEDADPLRRAISGTPVVLGDAATEYADSRAKLRANLSTAWKTPVKTEAA
ncbi:DUF2213 domain-containing protein [Companilactobacillus sp.]|uniref:DUF2213 domain-containing protein n=1 Tax=Companilactobacillus sp. TaxID=2767905 RepID=UPI00262F5793|nr:DUF2213 domain-containing protein [Companilactobacillus sp.]